MIQIHIRLPEETVDMIENIIEGKNRTDKIEQYICSNYVSKDYLLWEKEKCLSRLKFIEKNLKQNPFYNTNALSEEQCNFLIETIELVEKDPKRKINPIFMRARTNSYNTQFMKSIQPKEFELLLYKLKEKLEEKKA